MKTSFQNPDSRYDGIYIATEVSSSDDQYSEKCTMQCGYYKTKCNTENKSFGHAEWLLQYKLTKFLTKIVVSRKVVNTV